MSVSKPMSSPVRTRRLLASWYQGLVRGPDASSRVSIHSP